MGLRKLPKMLNFEMERFLPDAIPLLGIPGLKMKDIMGYCIIFFVVLTAISFGVWALMW